MKPVVIIAIAVGCSVAAVFGVLFALTEINNQQLQEYSNDLDLALSYKNQYYEITSDLCINEPPPSSYNEAVRGLEKSKEILRDFNRIVSDQNDLENKMSILSEKYPDNDYFVLEDATCLYQEEWDRATSALEEYRLRQSGLVFDQDVWDSCEKTYADEGEERIQKCHDTIKGIEIVEPLNNADQEAPEWCDDDGNCYRFSSP